MRLTLGTYPTPVVRFEGEKNLWIKRDDRTSAVYGGSKVRKLEPLLAEATARGATRILTMGAAGSHHVLACAIFGASLGLKVRAVLVPQPRTDHAVDDLRAAIAAGLEPIASSAIGMPFRVLAAMDPGTYLIPLGGSNRVGARSFVQAYNELAAQVARGHMPEPDEIVVTLGSGGTAAGLLAGLALAKSTTRLVAVAVSPPATLLARYVVHLASRLSGIRASELAERMELVTSELGAGYGHATAAGANATKIAARIAPSLVLDPTYTAKTFAAALDRTNVHPERTILYWHTLSSASLEPWLALPNAPSEAELPTELRQLFT